MRVILLILLTITLTCSLAAQEKLEDLSFYIEEYMDNLNTSGLSNGTPSSDYRAPWIEGIDFRTETRDWELLQQEYQLRIKPSTPKIRKYQKLAYQDLLTELEMVKSQVQYSGLKKVYENWLSRYYEFKEAQILEGSIKHYDDRIKVLSISNQKGEVDALEILKVKMQKEELQLEIKNLTKDISNLNIENSIISIDDIRNKLIMESFDLQNYPDMASDLFDLQKIDHQYELEKAEKNQAFDFAQLTYRGPYEDIWQERVSMSIAFTLPQSKRTNFDMMELEIERMVEQQRMEEKKLEFQNEIKLATENLQVAFDEYDERKEILEQLTKYDKILEEYIPRSKEEVLDLINLKMDKVDEEIDLIRLEENIYEEYLDFLEAQSIFTTSPSLNHLAKN